MLIKSKNKNKVISRDFSKKKKGNFFGKLLYWLCFFSFLGAAVYVLFFSPWVMITEINVSGAEDLNADSVRQAVVSQIDGKYFRVIDKNSFLLVSKNILQKYLAEDFKKIEKIKVEKKFPNKINITLVERKEVVVLCSNGQCFIIDEKGTAYNPIDLNNPSEISEHLLILKNENDREIKLGDFVFESDYAQYLLDIKAKLEGDLGIEIENEFSTPQLISGDIRVKAKQGWMIYFDKNISIEKEIKMLGLVLQDKLREIKREDIEYIDLRADNKIYYKLKISNPEENKPQEQSSEPIEKKGDNQHKKKS